MVFRRKISFSLKFDFLYYKPNASNHLKKKLRAVKNTRLTVVGRKKNRTLCFEKKRRVAGNSLQPGVFFLNSKIIFG